jgi:hypothetical protein
MHVGKLLASSRRKVSLAVHIAQADNVLSSLSAAADGVEPASSRARMPSHATALASPCFLERRVRRRLSPPLLLRSQRCLGVSLV